MERLLAELIQILQKMVTHQRSLMDIVRLERDALLAADLKGVQETTLKKELSLESIYQVEQERLAKVAEIAVLLKMVPTQLRLTDIIRESEVNHAQEAKSLLSVFNTLTVLIQRISEQNKENKILCENFLVHINEMKRNVLGEADPKAATYSASGKRSGPTGQPRLFEKEA